ncbi:MAG: flagellar basal-body rod protein FlgF [Gammaproteobacteria bacterium]|nr:flagellar basal-body rod protein FlgF [Gammaproteobacteria bacterium]
MDRMLFVAMSGAKELTTAQAVNSNNLANASTTGFRADFQTSLSQQVYGPGHPSRIYATTEGAGVDFSHGNVISTGREMDVAINGKGWIAVQAADGSEAYTRAGDFKIDSLGQLTTGAGHVVLGEGGPIAIPPYEKFEMGTDGTISIRPLGQAVNTLAVIDRIKLVNPDNAQLQKGFDGLMKMQAGQVAESDASVSIVSGSLESSNVNTVGSMVRMIELARQYETNIKLMRTAEENDEAAAKMIQMS